MQQGAFCGVFDGHGKNGHIVSKIVRNRLPSLLISQKNSLAKIKAFADDNNDKGDNDLVPSKSFHKWKEACINAFKVMDQEIKLQENLDCSCSGTTAVVVVRQVRNQVISSKQINLDPSFFPQYRGKTYVHFAFFYLLFEKSNRVKILL